MLINELINNLRLDKVCKLIFEFSFIKTLRINFYYFKFKDALKLPIIVSRHVKLKSVHGKVIINKLKPANIYLGFDNVGIFDNIYERSIWEVDKNSLIIFEGSAILGNGFRLSLMNGKLVIGDNFKITAKSTIICSREIIIGNDCLFSWDCLVMDTDFHKIFLENKIINEPKPIKIGDKVWIGCRSIILKGVTIENGCVISAGSTIRKDVTQRNTIIGNCKEMKIIRNNINWNK